MTKKYSSQ